MFRGEMDRHGVYARCEPLEMRQSIRTRPVDVMPVEV